jgi:hypothetical protein
VLRVRGCVDQELAIVAKLLSSSLREGAAGRIGTYLLNDRFSHIAQVRNLSSDECQPAFDPGVVGIVVWFLAGGHVVTVPDRQADVD